MADKTASANIIEGLLSEVTLVLSLMLGISHHKTGFGAFDKLVERSKTHIQELIG